jgi:hypothetical protein
MATSPTPHNKLLGETMKSRIRKLTFAGVAIIAVAAIACVALVRWTAVGYDAHRVFSWPSEPEARQPVVMLGYDGPYWHVADAIRIDVKGGVPHRRSDGGVIDDVQAYVNSALLQNPRSWVVVSAAVDERFGGIVQVVDACRATHAKGIVVNQFEVRE